MRIAFLVPTIYDLGGTASAVSTQANALAGDHEVEILSVYRPADETHFPLADGVLVRELVDTRAERPADEALEGRRLVRPEWDPTLDARGDVAVQAALPSVTADVLVTVTPALLALAAQLRPESVALVHQEHRSSSQRTSGFEPLLTFAPRADVVAMLTEPMAHWLGQRLLADTPHVVVVPNAIPPGFRPRSLLDAPLIVAAGRLAGEKQYPQLVAAFGLVADRLPDWRLRIFGDGPARFETMQAVRRLGLWDRVELPGPTTDLATEWARAGISAMTSRSEGFPLVMQEAMAAGVPVASYDSPSGPRAIIDDEVDGLLVAQGSEQAMADALLRLATDHELRHRLGAAALRKAATFDSVRITSRWVEIYDEAVRRKRSGQSAPPTPPRPQHEAPPGAEGQGVSPDEATAAAAAAVGVAGAVVTGTSAVVPMDRRRAFLDALAAADLPAYLSLHDPEADGWPSRRAPVADLVPHLRRGRTTRVLLEPWPLVAGTPSPLAGSGVVVSFVD
ncbi:MAG: glycosyltransferase [Actinomycetota bacterium]|nr:glycosyltransferase [Actinomycetota bacterium]